MATQDVRRGSRCGGRFHIAVAVGFLLALLARTTAQAADITITSPLAGATVSGTIAISVTAVPQVTSVRFFVDNTFIGTGPPYAVEWNSASVANGKHTI